ncbi:MAG: iron-sulfur cluster-binding protein [Gammaproteobacteria bacterium]|nr:iron-sulfur cluster-binding protein [Gammaproteobacteria bacterium]
MKSTAHAFIANSREALLDADLQRALAKMGFLAARTRAVQNLPEWDAIRANAREIKEHTLAHLDYYLERFEAGVEANGGQVHWCSTPAEASGAVLKILRAAGARRVTKGKSMAGEEFGINEALEANAINRLETDLGEYIIQLAGEPPSHIIAPAIHKTKEQITELFSAHHAAYGKTEPVTGVASIVNEAREVLREGFLAADAGITGANFLIAETGSICLVTNEGNGDLSSTLPRVHIVTAGIEKIVPSLEDLSVFLRLLARSATGQEQSVYTTLISGARRHEDLDGPAQFHVVLVDNGRSEWLGNEFHEMLRCIRCGACINHCPVWNSIGGHAYGWVYPGPMGSVLTPLLQGLEEAHHLPHACTMNGRCQTVCPMSIPLPSLLRRLRFRSHEQGLTGRVAALALKIWGQVAQRPRLYHGLSRIGIAALKRMGGGKGYLRRMPLASAWTDSRDFPAPSGQTFMAGWKARQDGRGCRQDGRG